MAPRQYGARPRGRPASLAAEEGRVVDLTDPATVERLETYVPLIAQGRGGEVLAGPS